MKDFGTHSEESVDYPVPVKAAARAVSVGDCDLAIVLGGSGNGEAMAANKVSGIRCVHYVGMRKLAVLPKSTTTPMHFPLGQRQITKDMAWSIVCAWLEAEFEGGRHERRIDLIETA